MGIRRVYRGAGAALAGLGALAAAACGSRVPLNVQQEPTAPVATGTPSATPSETPSPTASTSTSPPPTAPPSPSPTDTPTPARSPRSPSSSPAPTHPTTPPGSPSADPSVRVVPGRPLRQRRRILAPSLGLGDAPVHADRERLAAVPEATALAALWLHAARMEHASVPAFADLALLLAATGAPLDLVASAHRAALDEVGHTEVSYAFANAYGGTAHAPGALPRLLGRRIGSRLRGPRAALRRLAVEALRDGCLNEGYNAALAAAGASAATDPAVREALGRIAREEAAHTALSWQVLGWSLAVGGAPVRRAVARALRSLPESAAAPTPHGDLEPHGWPSPETAAAAFARTRAEVAERAAGLLALSA